MKTRIDIAIEFMKEGKSFRVGNLRLGADNKGNIIVTGWSKWYYLENLTKERAIEDLEVVKNSFYDLVNSSLELSNYISKKNIEFLLEYDVNGKTSINICSEKNGLIKWILKRLIDP